MPPSSFIASGVESGDQLAHTDITIAPHVMHYSMPMCMQGMPTKCSLPNPKMACIGGIVLTV